MPKIKKKSFGDRVERGVSLAEQIIHDKSVKQSGRTKQRNRRVGDDEVRTASDSSELRS